VGFLAPIGIIVLGDDQDSGIREGKFDLTGFSAGDT
jgi:hypothetical protein